ncbi:MAG: sodium:proton antiporter [Rhodoferax sp.]|uniref:hydrogen gas-evolving membrane-bound hydrogenase subunit E n=1 Tax=Rhodoferax sp. TaxID=50421 RepID=UPI001B7286EE|nr:hydrogen gas-evolving membrane-bound hydrogenase subunit E [Rhodoferax sp.]MBP9905652.1 sodium:proton antiporter [Rhodoferax sp.]
MIKRFIAFAMMAGLGVIFMALLAGYEPDAALNLTALYYAENTAREIGAANIVTAIVVTYRGLDTLGEVTVLFLASTIVGLVLSMGRKTQAGHSKLVPVGELLTTGSRFLAPLVMLLGVYIFVNGHLTPGGGFQGGAVIASGALLLLLADPLKHLSHTLISVVESFAGAAYVLIGVLGLILAGGFLDNRFLPLGDLGVLFSAGAIPLIYSLIGLKVGAEFASILANLSQTEEL